MRQSGSEPLFDSDRWPVVGNNCYDYAFGDNEKKRLRKSEPGEHIGKPGTLFNTCGKGRNSMKNRILADNPKSVYALPRRGECIPCQKGYYKVMAFVAPKNIVGETYGDFHFYKQVGSVRYQIQQKDSVAKLAKFFRVKPTVIKEALSKVRKSRTKTNGMIDDPMANQVATIHSSLVGKMIKFPVNLWAHKLGWGTRPLLVDAKGKTIYDPRKANRKYDFNYTTLCGAYCVRVGKAKTGNSQSF